MVPAKEAKEILYNMFAQNFVTITVSTMYCVSTVKVLNFRTPEYFAVIYLIGLSHYNV